jgi:hypothetical protein
MTTEACRKSGRKHTPIVSKAQQGMFGAELERRREGKKSRMSGITTAELRGHLKESAGKNLPAKSQGRDSAQNELGAEKPLAPMAANCMSYTKPLVGGSDPRRAFGGKKT